MNDTFTSHSSNFSGAVSSGVDPRTGQYSLDLPLANLVGNNMLGPELPLNLRYSSLNQNNEGYGAGFSISITQYNQLTHTLALSSGEIYRVVPGSDQVRDQKLKNFRFAFTNGKDATDGFTVFWKEGKVELLTLVGTDSFVTSSIRSPVGRRLDISWGWSGQYPLLLLIEDETSVLCSCSHGQTSVITIWPGSEEEYNVSLDIVSGTQLNGVSRQVSATETLSWYFGYSAVQGAKFLLLTDVEYPTKLKESVRYTYDDGLRYPTESGITSLLPVVISCIRTPGPLQVATVTNYEYSTQNFLGYNGNFGNWSQDSDFLYATLTDYQYSSIETVMDGSVTIETVRTYNNYHLQVKEEVHHQGNTHLIEFKYYAEEGLVFSAQPPQFQLVRKKVETWTDSVSGSRTEVTLSEFDEHGNPILEIAPDGTQTVLEWYGSLGEGGCPAEPHGFTRFLKSKVVTPRYTTYPVPVKALYYRYETLGDTPYIGQSEVKSFSGTTLLRERNTQHSSDLNAEFGRITMITDTHYEEGENSASFTSRQTFTTAVSNGLMSQAVTFIGHDDLQAVYTRVQSAFSGLRLSETDTQGVVTAYEYDLMGRLLKRISASGTPYESVHSWEHILEKTGPSVIAKDASGNQQRLSFDGDGRLTKRSVWDVDTTQQWYDVTVREYDSFGEIKTSTASDWFTDGGTSQLYQLTSSTVFDQWGIAYKRSFSDGTEDLEIYDPIRLKWETYQQGAAIESGKFITILDTISKLPVSLIRQDVSGQEQSQVLQEWDGLGLLRKRTDERGYVTEWTYDAYDRVLTQLLPDGSEVSWTYATHRITPQITSVSVTGPDAEGNRQTWLLGTQEFDSLGRMTKQTVGGRTLQYAFVDAATLPSTVTMSNGQKLEYTFIPELGNVVSSLVAGDLNQTFSYDKVTSELLVAQEGATKNHNTWSSLGSLKEESCELDGETYSTQYVRTLGGVLLSSIDSAGQKRENILDRHGRIVSFQEGSLAATMDYNALGQLVSQTYMDSVRQVSLTTLLEYDDFGREALRTVNSSSGTVISVAQTWLENGLLKSRLTQQDGQVLKYERYEYDGRNRLVSYQVSGSTVPHDAYGYPMSGQDYQYDALNNLTRVTTQLKDGSVDTALYLYEFPEDPTRLTAVTHTYEGYPPRISLEYDEEGRLTKDEAGRRLSYDATGRLTASSDGEGAVAYGYDALNRLVSQGLGPDEDHHLYYSEDELVTEVVLQQQRQIRLIKAGHSCAGVLDGAQLSLLAVDQHDSLLFNQADGQLHGWSPYGAGKGEGFQPGFNGERIDPVSGAYHLGNGYRAFNPVLMRFNCPDSLSPFGGAGVNAYAYCEGDPVNRTDPSGHLSAAGTAGIVTGTLGLLLAVVTGGMSIAAAGGVTAALASASAVTLTFGALAVTSDVTAIVSGGLEESNPDASQTLGWVSLATAIVGLSLTPATGINLIKSSALAGNRRRAAVSGLSSAAETADVPGRSTGVSRRVRRADGLDDGGASDAAPARRIGVGGRVESYPSQKWGNEALINKLRTHIRDETARVKPVREFTTKHLDAMAKDLDSMELALKRNNDSQYRFYVLSLGRNYNNHQHRNLTVRAPVGSATSHKFSNVVAYAVNKSLKYDLKGGNDSFV